MPSGLILSEGKIPNGRQLSTSETADVGGDRMDPGLSLYQVLMSF
jgi:hypothetical protein